MRKFASLQRFAGGFSLAETILSLFLIFMVLGVAGQLLNGYANVQRFSAGKENTFMVAQVALQQMVDEVRESTTLESPAIGSQASDLRFQKFDPAFTGWLPTPLPQSPPYSWSPTSNPASLIEIHYYLLNGQLYRDSGPSGGSPTGTQVVGTLIAGLQTNSSSTGMLDVSISCQEQSRVTSFDCQVLRPLP